MEDLPIDKEGNEKSEGNDQGKGTGPADLLDYTTDSLSECFAFLSVLNASAEAVRASKKRQVSGQLWSQFLVVQGARA